MKRWLIIVFWMPLVCWSADDFTMDFDKVNLRELIRLVYGEFLHESFVIDESIDNDIKPVTLKLRGMTFKSAESLLVELLRRQDIEVRKFGGVVVVARRDESRSIKETLIYRPKFRSSSYLQQAMASIFPAGAFANQRSSGMSFSALGGGGGAQPQGSASGGRSAGSRPMPTGSYASGVNTLTEYDSDVLVFLGSPDEIKRFTSLVASLDQPMGEVMVKAIVYEVRHEQREGSAIDLAASLLTGQLGVNFSAGVVDGSSLMVRFERGSNAITSIYSALSSDERFKIVSSPRVRVRSGSTARLSVGDDVPVLSSVSYDGQDRPIQSVEYKSSGVIFELTPKVRESVIDLKINQQISSFIATTTGVDASPTLTKRELATELTLSSDNDVVLIGGLESTSSVDGTSGLSFFPDWLRAEQTDNVKSEILLMLHVQRL
jgi:type II secretory pathway component GspD/PulD (secretin)